MAYCHISVNHAKAFYVTLTNFNVQNPKEICWKKNLKSNFPWSCLLKYRKEKKMKIDTL